jgi:hypothetical protein
MLLFTIVFATSLTGLLHVSWWAAIVGGCALALALLADDHDEGLGLGEVAATLSLANTVSSLMISAAAATAAFGIGRITAVVWGV